MSRPQNNVSTSSVLIVARQHRTYVFWVQSAPKLRMESETYDNWPMENRVSVIPNVFRRALSTSVSFGR